MKLKTTKHTTRAILWKKPNGLFGQPNTSKRNYSL